MSNPEQITIARVIVALFAVIEWGVVAGYLYTLIRNRATPLIKGVAFLIFIAAVPTINLAQLHIYSSLTSIRKPMQADHFVFGVLFIENLVAIFLIFYLLIKERSASRPLN